MTQQAFQHLYGMMDGVFVTAILLLLMFAFKSRRTFYSWHVSAAYLVLAVSLSCFGLYNLFFQQTHDPVTLGFYPDWLVKLGAVSIPIALALLTYVFHESMSLYSYNAARFIRKYQYYLNLLYVVYAGLFVALWFVDDIHMASRLLLIGFLFPCTSGTLISWVGLRRTSVGKAFGFAFVFLLLGTCVMTWLTFDNRLMNKPLLLLGIHLSYAVVVVLICHAMLSMGRDELNHIFKQYAMDTRHLLKQIVPALQNNQFELYLQPQLDLETNEVSGAEVLIRWNHPQFGQIRPVEFIPLAEESGYIEHITQWIISQSVKYARQLADAGKPIEISMNFSAACFNATVVSHLATELNKFNVPAERFVVEITENMALRKDNPDVTTALKQLNRMGVKLSIDDYGTGFSSLSYLKQMSVRELKIDKAFITDMTHNRDNFVIVYSTLQMTKSLGISVVAEGVETADVQSQLTSLGCEKAQGYGIAKPMPYADLLKYLGIAPEIVVSTADITNEKLQPETI